MAYNLNHITGHHRTAAPVVKRATVQDSRTAQSASHHWEREEYRPDPAILSVMRQRHGVCG